MELGINFQPPFEHLYENVCSERWSNDEVALLLQNLKKHIKREYINVNYHKEYFKTIFFILNNRRIGLSEHVFSCCYSALCYLVKRLSMQQQELLIYNERNMDIIVNSLNFLFENSSRDNNTKKAILSVYLLQIDSFPEILLKVRYQETIVDFIFTDILSLYSDNMKLKEKELRKYEFFFQNCCQQDLNVAAKINQRAKALNIDMNITDSREKRHSVESVELFANSFKPERQLHSSPSTEQRLFNNIDYFYKQLSSSYPQEMFDGKETEANWQKRQQYIMKLTQLYQLHSENSRISEQHIIYAVVCLKSLRTSVLSTSINFLTTIFSGHRIEKGIKISEPVYLRLMGELHHLIQTGKKILLQHIHFLFVLTILAYLKERNSSNRLSKLLFNIGSEKNPTSVKCCCDYLTVVLLFFDISDLKSVSPNANPGWASHYGGKTAFSTLESRSEHWAIPFFKNLNQSQFAEVRLRTRQNFWGWFSKEKQCFILSDSDDVFARRMGLGYEDQLAQLMQVRNSAYSNTETKINDLKLSDRKRENENLYADIDDLDDYNLEIANMEMTMIPYKKQKLLKNSVAQVDTQESRISSGETLAARDALDELEMEIQVMENGLTKIENLDLKTVIEKARIYFASNAYCINETVIVLEDNVLQTIERNTADLALFLNADLQLTFTLGVLLKINSRSLQNFVEAYLNRLKKSIFEKDFASILVFIRCCRKYSIAIEPQNHIEEDILTRFG